MFLYPAKLTSIVIAREASVGTGLEPTIELHVCPYCKNQNIDEIIIAKAADLKIVSVISVELTQVDEKLKEGYEVHDLYAKTATLVKKAVQQ